MKDTAALLEAAMASHQLGKLEQAEITYTSILAEDPRHFTATYLLGVLKTQQGAFQAAAEILAGALRLNPRSALAHLNLGLALWNLGQPEEALAHYQFSFILKPDHPETLVNYALALQSLRRHKEALARWDQLLALTPKAPSALLNRGMVLQDLQRFEEAMTSFDHALALDAGLGDVLLNRARELYQALRHEEALATLDKVLGVQPDSLVALLLRGIVLVHLEKSREALDIYDRILEQHPDSEDAFLDRGNALMGLQRYDDALASYDHALAIHPGYGQALLNRGAALVELKRYREALVSLDRGLALLPDHPDGLMNRGNALRLLHRPVEALASYDQVLALRPDHSDSHLNRGNAQLDLGRLTEALASYDRAILLKPDSLQALLNRANALLALKRPSEALASCDLALTLQRECVDALVNRGTALLDLRRPLEALASYDTALALQPNYPDLLMNQGTALHLLGRHREAIASYDKALALEPGHARAHSNKIYLLDFLPEVGFPEHQRERHHYYQAHARRLAPPENTAPNDRSPSRQLVLGYVSADFKHHSAASCFLPVLQRHSRVDFQINCYSGVQVEDDWTRRFRECADVWRSVSGLPDEALAARIRDDGVDILIDLSGHSKGNRLLVFARKPAPVQVTAWGHGGGTGLPMIDYHFTDPVSIPASVRSLFAEAAYDLPCCITFEAPTFAPPIVELPARRKGFITFGSLNRFTKVTPEVERLWAAILLAVPGSHLILKDGRFDDSENRNQILASFAELGIGAERIELRGFTSHLEHLATCGDVDIMLDTFPQNGGITTWEALWMGTPVIAMLGNKFASRISGAILHALGLGAWVGQEEGEYRDVAIREAADLDGLAQFRTEIRSRLLSSSAGNPERYTRAVEEAYRAMWRKWIARS